MFYGQRQEDQKICELLGGENIHREGFYIDVGAWDPNKESVTRFFYEELGFTGINIEPVTRLWNNFYPARAKDINLNCAIGKNIGKQTMKVVCNGHEITGLSTLHKQNSDNACAGRNSYEQDVEVFTLESICDTWAQGIEIDFLKIDVEGYEAEVIYSGNWAKYRPKVLCIEATVPLSDVKSDSWDSYVRVICKYDFVYFDGLNNFYVRREGW